MNANNYSSAIISTATSISTAASTSTLSTATGNLAIDSKSDNEWKITLFDAVKAGRVEEVEKLMEANKVSSNIENPKQKGEKLLDAATVIEDNELRARMLAVIKARVVFRTSMQQTNQSVASPQGQNARYFYKFMVKMQT